MTNYSIVKRDMFIILIMNDVLRPCEVKFYYQMMIRKNGNKIHINLIYQKPKKCVQRFTFLGNNQIDIYFHILNHFN